MSKSSKTVLLRFELERDIDDLEKECAQRCWTIPGVASCDFVDPKNAHMEIKGEAPDNLWLSSFAYEGLDHLSVSEIPLEFREPILGLAPTNHAWYRDLWDQFKGLFKK